MNYFITAIGTDSGKTLVSAIVTEALKADYWKPIQAGEPKDSDAIKKLISNDESLVLSERYILNTPASPHMAASIDGVKIRLEEISLPKHKSKHLVIEGAGGILVPINEDDYVIDIAKKIDCEVILVCDLYLGSINHSLLSLKELQRRKIPLKGIIFNGPSNPDSERIIAKEAKVPVLLHIEKEEVLNPTIIKKYAAQIKEYL